VLSKDTDGGDWRAMNRQGIWLAAGAEQDFGLPELPPTTVARGKRFRRLGRFLPNLLAAGDASLFLL